jgi:hypothetical protein
MEKPKTRNWNDDVQEDLENLAKSLRQYELELQLRRQWKGVCRCIKYFVKCTVYVLLQLLYLLLM